MSNQKDYPYFHAFVKRVGVFAELSYEIETKKARIKGFTISGNKLQRYYIQICIKCETYNFKNWLNFAFICLK